MIRCPLFTLPAAVVGTAALSIVSAIGLAQGTASKPQSDHAAAPAAKPAPVMPDLGDNTIVGTCNSHKVTWGQLIDKIKSDAPNVLQSSVSSLVATKVSDSFFGTPAKESFSITKAQVFSELRQHPNQAISQQLELMLTQMAVNDEATKENVQPTPKEVDDKIAALLKSLRDAGNIPKGQTDAQFLAAHHVTMDKLKENYRPQCQVLNLIHKDVVKQLGHPVGPDDMLIASHLLLKMSDLSPSATAEDKQKAEAATLARIKEILADIRAKKITLADAAKKDSDDPGTKDKGGDLGIVLRGQMVKEFDKAAFAAKVNEITDPVKSDYGYHIILVTKLGKDIPAADRTAFIDRYETQRIQQFLQKVVETDNKVENKLAKLVPPAPPMGGMPMGMRRPQ